MGRGRAVPTQASERALANAVLGLGESDFDLPETVELPTASADTNMSERERRFGRAYTAENNPTDDSDAREMRKKYMTLFDVATMRSGSR